MKYRTFSPASQTAQNKQNDEEMELFVIKSCEKNSNQLNSKEHYVMPLHIMKLTVFQNPLLNSIKTALLREVLCLPGKDAEV